MIVCQPSADDQITFYFTAHSFLCYKCEERDNYTKEQCEKNQKNIECSANIEATCFKQHIVKNDGTELEYRGCELKSSCKARKKNCEDEAKRKECEAACCITVGDTPCNSGVSVPANMIMVMMITAACSLRLVLG